MEGTGVKFSYLMVACGMLLTAACGQSDDVSSETSGTNETSADVASVEQSAAQDTSPAPTPTPASDEVDLANGERGFNACRGCHLINDSGHNSVGPNLYGVFGREAGTVEGFNYSPSFGEAEFVWTAESMDEFLAAPQTFMPGNRMPYPGMSNANDRADLISWLMNEAAPAN